MKDLKRQIKEIFVSRLSKSEVWCIQSNFYSFLQFDVFRCAIAMLGEKSSSSVILFSYNFFLTSKKSKHRFLFKEVLLLFSQKSDVNNPLGDDRFSAMFSNPDFQVDEESEVGWDSTEGCKCWDVRGEWVGRDER